MCSTLPTMPTNCEQPASVHAGVTAVSTLGSAFRCARNPTPTPLPKCSTELHEASRHSSSNWLPLTATCTARSTYQAAFWEMRLGFVARAVADLSRWYCEARPARHPRVAQHPVVLDHRRNGFGGDPASLVDGTNCPSRRGRGAHSSGGILGRADCVPRLLPELLPGLAAVLQGCNEPFGGDGFPEVIGTEQIQYPLGGGLHGRERGGEEAGP